MDLKKGVLYDAIHKKQTYFDPELQRDVKKTMVIEIVRKGILYHDIVIHEICGEEIKRDDIIAGHLWDYYEISPKEDYQKNGMDLFEIQWLAVELGCKDLFDKCKRDLEGGLPCLS
jgi:hypothetical protein